MPPHWIPNPKWTGQLHKKPDVFQNRQWTDHSSHSRRSCPVAEADRSTFAPAPGASPIAQPAAGVVPNQAWVTVRDEAGNQSWRWFHLRAGIEYPDPDRLWPSHRPDSLETPGSARASDPGTPLPR